MDNRTDEKGKSKKEQQSLIRFETMQKYNSRPRKYKDKEETTNTPYGPSS